MMAAKRPIRVEYLVVVVLALGASACGGANEGNMMSAPGNALSEAQIERALGPERVEPTLEPVGSESIGTSDTDNAATTSGTETVDNEVADPPAPTTEPPGDEEPEEEQQ